MTLTATKFHMAVNVSNLKRALDFYRVLFGLEPAKCHDDYAKFELADPPVIFSLMPQASVAGGSLGKIGLRLADQQAVDAARRRLQEAGIPTQASCPGNGAAGSKFYVADPDLNYWQVYCGEDTGGAPPAQATSVPAPAVIAGPVIWEHFVTGPLPERIPHADGSVDEVRLTGTFNAPLDESQRRKILAEARRVLKPGGQVVVHGLVGDRPFPLAQPKLPGLAAMVSRVPEQAEPPTALQSAGFTAIQFTKYSEKPWFVIEGVELREVKLTALQPAEDGERTDVIYRGPFQEAVDDAGRRFPMSQRVAVPAAAWQVGHAGAADQFIVAPALPKPSTCAVS